MKQSWVLLFLLLSSSFIPSVKSQSETTPQSLSLTIYTDGTTKVDYYLESDPTKIRVDVELFGSGIENVVVKDEGGNPLWVTVDDYIATVDSIGALGLYFTYLTKTLISEEDSIWLVNISSPVNVTIILPKNAQFLDMGELPTEIGSMGDSQYLVFSPGNQYVYYILGLPSMINEANLAISKVSLYLKEKEFEGYVLTGAQELLSLAQSHYTSQQYLEAKNNADEALIIAQDIVDFADSAKQAIESANDAIQEAKTTGRTEGLEEAESYLDDARSLYDAGSYRNAEIIAHQAEEAATISVGPANNVIYYVLVLVLTAGLVFLYVRKRM
jgi:hypothetical protein